MKTPIIRFDNEKSVEFSSALKQRVNQYFRENKISKHANFAMVFKTICMIALLFVPYFLLVLGVIENIWIAYILWFLMGLGVSGIGMSVMHDANHGAYSKHKWINKFLGRFLDLVGGNAANWRIQHNLLHHTYTNVHGMDGDIETRSIMRFSPSQKRKSMHRFQHIYAWFLYCLMTLQWLAHKDYLQMLDFRKRNLNKAKPVTFWTEYAVMVCGKLFYYTYMIVIPVIFTPFAWWQVLIGVLLMQFTTGFTLATTFQLAHVMPNTTFPEPDENRTIEENWMIHQLETTTDFAQKSVLISWFIGGLNFQVEHHLFPNICHIHYKKIAKIVEKTAHEYNVAYNNLPTLLDAMKEHKNYLKRLGSSDLSMA